MTARHLKELADRVAGAMPELDGERARVGLRLYWLLALGTPVSVEVLTAAAGIPEAQVRDMLASWVGVSTDADGAVVAFRGLGLSQTAHRFEVGGVVLHTWCAWDTLFLPSLLGNSACVTSDCPVTGELVRVTVTPERVEGVELGTAVLSLLRPDTAFDDDIVLSFCQYVRLFACPQAGGQWIALHPDTFLLSVEEGFELGRLVNAVQFGSALAAR